MNLDRKHMCFYKEINRKSIQWVVLVMYCFGMDACKESDLRKPLEGAGEKPGVVTDVQVVNQPGGAKITYGLPNSADILYVTADYEIRPGVKEQAVSSLYDNSLLVQGFSDTLNHDVVLTVVNRGGNESDPVKVNIRPQIAPILQVYKELTYIEDFGGITVNFINTNKADLSISVLRKDSIGDWTDYDRYYTSRPAGVFPVRGLPAELTTFGVYVTDRWGNNSDTIVKNLTPLFEEQFDKSKFTVLNLPGDVKNSWNTAGIWDNVNVVANNMGFSNQDAPFPKGFSFDMGVKGKLSRFRMWGVHDGREFSGGNIKTFEIWGSNSPAPDGSYDGWERLGAYEVVKPSAPGTTITAEDKEAAANGMDFAVSLDAPEVRYIRFKAVSTFASPPNSALGACWVLELTLWGQTIQ